MIRYFCFISLTLLVGCATQPLPERHSPSETKATPTDECKHTESAFHCVKVVEIYDGDSIFIDLPDQHPLFGKRMGVRILGIDTPEIKTKDSCEKNKAILARSLLEKLIMNAKRVDVVSIQKDKYFRVLGNVIADGKSVSTELINQQLAYSYFGEKKPKRDWCK
jgi:micrococcal nuclease